MYTIRVCFDRFEEIPLPDLFGAVGVYIIWDGRQRARPSYIGQGNILKRLSRRGHNGEKFAQPIRGYTAVLGDTSRKFYRGDSKIVETLLLEVAEEVDRWPTKNGQRGANTGIDRIFQKHGVLKVIVDGYDPLLPPWTAQPLINNKVIELRRLRDEIVLDHDWRMRRHG